MATVQGVFGEIQKKFFGCEDGAYTAITEAENNKQTYNMKASIKNLLISKVGISNIPRTGDGSDQNLTFHLWPGTEKVSVSGDVRFICKISKPDKLEMSAYISKVVPKHEMEDGDIWFIFFRKDDSIPWFGFMKWETWKKYFGNLPLPAQDEEDEETEQQTIFEPKEFLKGAENLIVYGAPGIGKSYYLENNKNQAVDDETEDKKEKKNITRTIFHPDYTYYDFVGSYKPVPLYKISPLLADGTSVNAILVTVDGEKYDHGEPVIDYQFVPGPFTKALIEAFSKPDEMHTLIIEELNRANAPAVFGDIFQLLDRDSHGKSEYTIRPDPELAKYLRRNNINISGLYIPSNLNIFATMNSADQGVFVMDTAFKRRWNFMYMSAKFNDKVDHAAEPVDYAGTRVTWNAFATSINERLGSSECKVNEDKFIGPYFLKEGEPSNRDRIASKLLIYLWDDVVRFQREKLFKKEITNFSDLIIRYNKGEEIFVFSLEDIRHTEETLKISNTEAPFNYLKGRLITEDLFNNDGNVLFKSGEIIDERIISDAANHNMINELEKVSKNT